MRNNDEHRNPNPFELGGPGGCWSAMDEPRHHGPMGHGDGPRPPHPGMHGPGHHQGPGFMPPLPPPEPDTPDGRLINLLRQAGHLAMMRPGLRAGQFRILSLLEQGQPVPQVQLAEKLRIQPGSLSEMLGKLEQAGLITRQRSEEDRRASNAQITQLGLNRLKEMRSTMDIERSELLCVLNDEEKKTLTELLGRIIADAGPRHLRGRPPMKPGPSTEEIEESAVSPSEMLKGPDMRL